MSGSDASRQWGAAAQQRCADEALEAAVRVLREAGVGPAPLLTAACVVAGRLLAQQAAPITALPMLAEAQAVLRKSMLAHLPAGGTA